MYIGIGNIIGRKGGQSWSSYWDSLISATIEVVAPTDIILTFPTGKPQLTKDDFSVGGFTINSASWVDNVLTLTLSTRVKTAESLVVTFIVTGQTANVTNNIGGWSVPSGVTAPVAVWQSIGMSSYANSKINLINPGTYDLIKVNAADPTWDTVNGWVGDGQTNGSILNTQITGNYGWSVVIFGSFTSQATAYRIFGTDDYFALYNRDITSPKFEFYRGAAGTLLGSSAVSAYCLAACNRSYYLDGSLVGVNSNSTTGDLSKPYYLMGMNGSTAAGGTYKIYAVAIYNYEISSPQLTSIIQAFLNP